MATDDSLDALARDCDFEFTRTGGPGGQHRNKADTAVRVTHRPTGLVVLASERRSQARNRKLALQRLASRLAEIDRERELEARRRARQARQPSEAEKRRRVEEKRLLGRKKENRRRLERPLDEE